MGIAVEGRRTRRARPSIRWLGNVRAGLRWEGTVGEGGA